MFPYRYDDNNSNNGAGIDDGGSFFTAEPSHGMVDGMSELQALRYQLDQLDREPPIGTANGNGGNGDASAGSGDGKDVESILRRSVAQLKRSMLVQKRGHSKEVQHLTHELKEARQNEERLEQLLVSLLLLAVYFRLKLLKFVFSSLQVVVSFRHFFVRSLLVR